MGRNAAGWNRARPHYTAPAAKALVAGLVLMLAMDDGFIALDDPAFRFIPEWRDDPVKSRITIRQLASHTAGLEDAEEGGLAHEALTGWKGAFWKREENPFLIARDQAPVLFAPGTGEAYSNTGIAMLCYALGAVLAQGPRRSFKTALSERIMRPLGVPDWSGGSATVPYMSAGA